jgi:CTP synthase (UTP-ammonia lyase)
MCYVPDVLEKQELVTSIAKILYLESLNISPQLVLKAAATWDIWKKSTTQEDLKEIVSVVFVGKYQFP